MKTNYKKVIIGVTIFITLFFSVIAAYVYFNQKDSSNNKKMLVKGKLPDGYFDPREVTIVKHVNEDKQSSNDTSTTTKEEPPKKSLTNYVQDLVGDEEVDYYELKKNQLNYKRAQQVTHISVIKSEPIEPFVQENKTTQPLDDSNLYDPDFGIEKDVTSRFVKLQRVITADKMISATLLTAVNSLLPGKVVAIIEHNIYGSHGRTLLIPKGSTATGTYDPIKKIGEERLAIQWYRIITPNGININLSNSLSADGMGRAGSVGELDNRYMERYGLSLAITSVSSGLSYAAMQGTQATATNTAENETSLKNEVIRDYKNDVGRVSDQVLKQQLNIKPVINLKAGERVFISPILDIWFPDIFNDNINVEIYKGEKQ